MFLPEIAEARRSRVRRIYFANATLMRR